MRNMLNPFELEGNWYKANLHMHTTTSDGGWSVVKVVREYRRRGYDVLALTDHLKTNDVRGLSDERMLVIGGVEFHPFLSTRAVQYHFVGLNVPHDLHFDDGEDALGCIAQVRRLGGETILAHPYWSGLEYADFCQFEDLAAVEVYNYAADENGRSVSENEWAFALDRGWKIPAVAVDDAHCHSGPSDAFGGWTWLKMPALSADNVVTAVLAGACYASGGPRIHDFRVEDGRVTIRCSPVVKVYFKANSPGLGRRRVAEVGKEIRGYSVDVAKNWKFVRAVVIDAQGRQAWTNPIYL
ncbi:MAG: CehA/McbA family metallohydrolase [Planctomycetes bacterium]|nr:CehA/McbA family metallohydrolase [Planctomycetota bacterium]